MENFRAAAGERIDARFFHFQQRVLDRKLREARVVVHLDHGEGLQMHLRKALLQAADQVEVIIERKIGMQAANDVEFRGAFGDAFRAARENFVERKSVRAGTSGERPKAQSLQCATQTLVGLMWRLTLK